MYLNCFYEFQYGNAVFFDCFFFTIVNDRSFYCSLPSKRDTKTSNRLKKYSRKCKNSSCSYNVKAYAGKCINYFDTVFR